MNREVEVQIRLLRSVLWWYLAPCLIAVLAIGLEGVNLTNQWQRLSLGFAIVLLVFAGIYWLNQRCARMDLEPRRQRLQQILDDLRTG
jgi:hypothetical protein